MEFSNPAKGKAFRDTAWPILERELGVSLEPEVILLIGRPPKQHKFDLVSKGSRVGTRMQGVTLARNGNVPQAKITSITEAASFLRDYVQNVCRRVLVLNRATHAGRGETLAEYYVRLHRHALAGVVDPIEIDSTACSVKWLVGNVGGSCLREEI